MSKVIAIVAKDKGFRDDYLVHYLDDNKEISFEHRYGFNSVLIPAPANEQLINWIFKKVYISPIGKETFAAIGADEFEWLKFWYDILINSDFTLIDEYIRRLLNYFTDIKVSYSINKQHDNRYTILYDIETEYDCPSYYESARKVIDEIFNKLIIAK